MYVICITIDCFSFWLLSHRTGRIPGIWSVLTVHRFAIPLRNSIASTLEKTPSSQTLQVAYSYLWWQSHVWSLKFHQRWHVATSFALPWHNGGQTLYVANSYFCVPEIKCNFKKPLNPLYVGVHTLCILCREKRELIF